jgi:hypothetical protein
MTRIAVLFLHGVEITDPEYAATPIRLIEEEFTRHLGPEAPDPQEALAFHALHLAPALEDQQRAFFAKECPGGGERFFDNLRVLVHRVTAGQVPAIVPMLLAILRRKDPVLPGIHYPAARWVLAHFLGDAVAYQATPSNREIYDQLHRGYADALRSLAGRAGGDAPLCVMAHSFGTIISSDFFYDRETERQAAAGTAGGRRATALERGETLTWLYTMGSPMALWSLRYPAAMLSAPIQVPAPEMHDRGELKGEWVNLIDEDDLAAWPLQPLGPEYAAAVTDRRVRVRAPPLGWTPLVHPYYWADREIVAPIARRLADAWAAMQVRSLRARTPAPARPVGGDGASAHP